MLCSWVRRPHVSLFLPKCNNNHPYMYGQVPLLQLCVSSTSVQYAIVESKSEVQKMKMKKEEEEAKSENEITKDYENYM